MSDPNKKQPPVPERQPPRPRPEDYDRVSADEEEVPYERTYRDGSAMNECWRGD